MRYFIGSSLMLGLKGPEISKEERNLLVKEKIAGVILFQRNILSFRQLFELCQELKSLASKRKASSYFFIGMDLEGGKVNRLAHLKEGPSWPSALQMSRLPKEKLFQLARKKGLLLSALGVDINFAPVADILLKNSSVLETRTFGNQQKKLTSCVLTYARGLAEGGVMPCLKHFPGHGGVAEDSHESLPKDTRSLKSLTPQIAIFKQALTAPVPFVMTAHLEFARVERGSATFSKFFLRQILREQLHFKGVIVSDDIDMKALTGLSPGRRFFKALVAGCNLILCCQKQKTPYQILEFFKDTKKTEKLQPFLKESYMRLLAIKQTQKKKKFSWRKVQQTLKL